VIIFETSIFTRQITTLMDDDEYAEFQGELAERPDMGVRIPGSGGLRKVRVTAKRGGARVIYYWAMSDSRIFMLLAYAKNEQEDLTKDQLKVLKALVEEEFGDG